MMDPTNKQQVCIRFCANLRKSAMIRHAFREGNMIQTQYLDASAWGQGIKHDLYTDVGMEKSKRDQKK
jgi:hypothetical protein